MTDELNQSRRAVDNSILERQIMLEDEATLPEDDQEMEGRGSSFRARRLTYTSNNLASAAAALEGLDYSDDEELDDATRQQSCDEDLATTNNNNSNASSTAENKESSFRERRLTYTSHNMADAAKELEGLVESDEDDEDNNIGDSSKLDSAYDDSLKKRKLAMESKTKAVPTDKRLKSRVVHASLPVQHSHQNSKLYRHVVPNPANNDLAATNDKYPVSSPKEDICEPEWKRRHHDTLDCDLPFPRHVVGTYSCHGVEPLYDFSSCNDSDNDNLKSIAKINQDRGGVAYPYGNCPWTALFAAYDGHGDGGELVAQYALHQVQCLLEKHPLFDSNIQKAMTDTFLEVDKSLSKEEEIEPWYSGCTAIVTMVRGKQLIVANCGDSRAVLATKTPNGLKAVDLSQDQNPDTPGEKERIISSGGFVSPPPEEGLSARVWLDAHFTQIGLAMARSIGDHAVREVGVIANPEVQIHDIDTENDQFIIIATDGVWEFLSSQDAVDIVQTKLRENEESCCASSACQNLIEAAAAKWHQYEGDYRDDITALIVRVDKLWGYMDDMEQKQKQLIN